MPTTLHQQLAEEEIINLSDFELQLANAASTLPVYKEALGKIKESLDERFKDGDDIRKLVYGRAWEIDRILQTAWAQFNWPEGKIALIAVGGYGRGELHPHSDIDLLILLSDDLDAENHHDSISGFLTQLWDMNLDIGSSVRTISECYKEAQNDITIATNLIESRTLTGNDQLHTEMYNKVTSEDAWSDKEFFIAKLNEQKERHKKTNNTEYNLEPNLKNSPGGLRDLQTIGWVAKRHFGSTYIRDLVADGFLTEPELEILNKGELYLWSVRYALHMICNRREDRLLFDHQRSLAEFFGYTDEDGKLAVEQFMSKYYRIAMAMSEFNGILLQHFDEAILRATEKPNIQPLNNRFQIHNDFIELTREDIFEKKPFALMELFVLLAQNPQIKGVRASTIRLIRDNRHRIDDDFRKDIRNTSLFMELLRCPESVSTQLSLMTRYGILGRYLPAFGNIIGQMQHDLFHIYTVDAHTMKVIQMCRQFRHNEYREEFPIAHRIVNQLPKIELLYIAALFHDIAKGRGGDHSELGATDALEFCEQHHLGKWDSHLVAWLVQSHLLMSMTAQRKDISDPDVIHTFAKQVRDVLHLDYLYVLTIADINATNHTLWNSWRATLMRKLYTETKRALRRGLENPINKEDRIEQIQHEAMAILKRQGLELEDFNPLWSSIGEEYFLHETAQSIAEHTKAIIEHGKIDEPLILIRQTSHRVFEGATEIFIYSKDIDNLFAATVAAMDQLHLNIQDARIIVTESGEALNTYTVLSDDNTPLSENPEQLSQIKQILIDELDDPDDYPDIIQRRIPRQMKLFTTPTQVYLSNDPTLHQTVLEVITPDRPGLLARVGGIFSEHNLSVRKAKIASVGEKVEDFFFITDQTGSPIADPALCQTLQDKICLQLDENIELEKT
ncbi:MULTISPECIES: [protein-PII] uridylyltransferase [unclassified Neptuniibacter]|uniref:[protein-PII] uridylyltransferase n=1 Tax=unclassified Neptuniibacter TaxID=2630693 RepID=UPI000C3B1E14|nr:MULTISPECIES: [protein-PII] uridylyltransferase [unclassified Neptuniibacter]MAY43203.1 [protein-PII] uridylyltransferase [Oceanospirillaceae bacterium]|tara:strand:+ start:8415 stop:11117 length:2703 start_codon:yes stop_codon:yes gene_type:complete